MVLRWSSSPMISTEAGSRPISSQRLAPGRVEQVLAGVLAAAGEADLAAVHPQRRRPPGEHHVPRRRARRAAPAPPTPGRPGASRGERTGGPSARERRRAGRRTSTRRSRVGEVGPRGRVAGPGAGGRGIRCGPPRAAPATRQVGHRTPIRPRRRPRWREVLEHVAQAAGLEVGHHPARAWSRPSPTPSRRRGAWRGRRADGPWRQPTERAADPAPGSDRSSVEPAGSVPAAGSVRSGGPRWRNRAHRAPAQPAAPGPLGGPRGAAAGRGRGGLRGGRLRRRHHQPGGRPGRRPGRHPLPLVPRQGRAGRGPHRPLPRPPRRPLRRPARATSVPRSASASSSTGCMDRLVEETREPAGPAGAAGVGHGPRRPLRPPATRLRAGLEGHIRGLIELRVPGIPTDVRDRTAEVMVTLAHLVIAAAADRRRRRAPRGARPPSTST